MVEDKSIHTLLVQDLNLYYGDTAIVKNVSFKADINECLVILGTNGAGKTSTFKCITSETAPTHGQV